jgi:hypothetical protein
MNRITTDHIHSLYEKFEKYNEHSKKQYDALKEKYQHVSSQKIAYWQFCAEAQKRAYQYNQVKEKITAWSDLKDISNRHKASYDKIIEDYYVALYDTVLEPTFYNEEDTGTFFEFKFTETEYYDEKEDDEVAFPDEIVHYNMYEPQQFLSVFKDCDDQLKVDAISAISRFGTVVGKDTLTETRMTNIYIQPIHLFHDHISINIDFNLTDDKLKEYVIALKRKFNSLSEEAKTMPSQLIKKNMLDSQKNSVLLLDTTIARRIYSADESEYPRLLLMYDGLLMGISKSATSTLIAQALPRKLENGSRISFNTQKIYKEAVDFITNDFYISQCELLQDLKSKNLSSF